MIGFDAVKHLVLCRTRSGRQPNLRPIPIWRRCNNFGPRVHVLKGAALERAKLLLAHHLKAEGPSYGTTSPANALPGRLTMRYRRHRGRSTQAAWSKADQDGSSPPSKAAASAMPSLNKMVVILELARCEYIQQNGRYLAIAASGKTHIFPVGLERGPVGQWRPGAATRDDKRLLRFVDIATDPDFI